MNRSSFLITLFILATLSGCSAPTTQKADSPPSNARVLALDSSDQVVLVSTTDFHSAFERAEGLANSIQSLRTKYPTQMVYVDAGDLFQGSLEGDLAKGEANVKFFNLIGLDVAALGNHEFDFGPNVPDRIIPNLREDPLGTLRKRIGEAKFQWISANWVRNKGATVPPLVVTGKQKLSLPTNALNETTMVQPNAIVETKGGIKTCFIGATTPTTSGKTLPQYLVGTRFLALKETVEAEASDLRQKQNCDFVVLVAHAGLSCSDTTHNCLTKTDVSEILDLAQALKPKTLDAIIAGHTHQKAQEVVNGTPILEAGSRGQTVGVLHLFKTRSGQSADTNFAFEPFVNIASTEINSDVTVLLKPYRDQASTLKKQVVGSASEVFIRDISKETALGNLVADAAFTYGKEHGGADLALVQAAILRDGLPNGELRYEDVAKVLPFSNSFVTARVTGAQLKTLLSIATSGPHGLALVSGVKIKLRSRPVARDLNGNGQLEPWEMDRVEEVLLANGRPLDPKKVYQLVTTDYLAFGGDHEDVVYNSTTGAAFKLQYGPLVRDTVSLYVQKHSPLRAVQFYDQGKPRYSLNVR